MPASAAPVHRPAETNRLLFLQAPLAVREQVYLLYNCRDVQKDQELHPSSMVNQVRRRLAPSLPVTTVPLLGSDPCFLQADALPNSSTVECLLAVQEARRNHLLILEGDDAVEVERRLAEARELFADCGEPVGQCRDTYGLAH